MKRKYCLIFSVVFVVLLFAGCGNKNSSVMGGVDGIQSTDTGQNQSNKVFIQNSSFSPQELTVKVGTKVTWTNMDPVNHQIKSPVFGSGALSTGQTFDFTFITPGTYNYSCVIHSNMTGKITVEE